MILDIMFFGMSGYMVCERICEVGNGVGVFLFSVCMFLEDCVRGFDVGVN